MGKGVKSDFQFTTCLIGISPELPGEAVDEILRAESFRIERIVSRGQALARGFLVRSADGGVGAARFGKRHAAVSMTAGRSISNPAITSSFPGMSATGWSGRIRDRRRSGLPSIGPADHKRNSPFLGWGIRITDTPHFVINSNGQTRRFSLYFRLIEATSYQRNGK